MHFNFVINNNDFYFAPFLFLDNEQIDGNHDGNKRGRHYEAGKAEAKVTEFICLRETVEQKK